MKPAAFDYVRPAAWAEALALLEKGALPMAGGQSLGPMLNLRLVMPDRVLDLRHLPGQAGVTVQGDMVRIGVGTTHAAIEDGAVPGRLGAVLARIARRIAYRAIRNRGSIGGSLVHADPAADWCCVLPAFLGYAIALGPRGERRIPLDKFILGLFETALQPGELLCAVELPVLSDAARFGHWKFCRKPGAFSKASACVLALPGVAPRAVLAALDRAPIVITDASALLAAPEEESARIVARLDLEDPWRAALARVALRDAAREAT